MSGLDPARREELAAALQGLEFDNPRKDAEALTPLIARWLATARAEGAAEVRARVEAAFSGDDYEENAAAAAGEGEWSWFRWLAMTALAEPAEETP